MDITLPEVQTSNYQVKGGQASCSREELQDILAFLRDAMALLKDVAPWVCSAWAAVRIVQIWASSPSAPAIQK